MIRKLLITTVFVALAAPAFAFHCPADMAKIDAALQTAQLSATDLAKVREYRQKGAEFHSAGQHQQAIDILADAMKILGI